MKKTKVLIPALGILSLSMAASITGTVAWFSANASVTARGMRIAAATDSSLLISKELNTTYGYTMEFTPLTNATVMPVSPMMNVGDTHSAGYLQQTHANVDSIDWYIKGGQNAVADVDHKDAAVAFGSFAAGDLSDAGSATYTLESAWAAATSNYAKGDMFLKLEAGKAEKQTVKLNITVTSAAVGGKAIDQALHIGLHINRNQSPLTTNMKNYPDNMGGEVIGADALSLDKTFVHYDITSFEQPGAEGTDYTLELPSFLTIEAYKIVKVTAYAWYEGEDEDCTSTNANIVNELTIQYDWSLEGKVD